MTSLFIPADWLRTGSNAYGVAERKAPLEVVAILFHIRSFYLDVSHGRRLDRIIGPNTSARARSEKAIYIKPQEHAPTKGTHTRPIRLLQPFLSQFVPTYGSRSEESQRLARARDALW